VGRTVETAQPAKRGYVTPRGGGVCHCTESVQKWPPTSSSGDTAAGDLSAFSSCQSARIRSWHTMAFAPKCLASLGLKFNCKTRHRSNCSGSNNMSLKMKKVYRLSRQLGAAGRCGRCIQRKHTPLPRLRHDPGSNVQTSNALPRCSTGDT
jgi:hypothetical protein